jgi:hypothetical protein
MVDSAVVILSGGAIYSYYWLNSYYAIWSRHAALLPGLMSDTQIPGATGDLVLNYFEQPTSSPGGDLYVPVATPDMPGAENSRDQAAQSFERQQINSVSIDARSQLRTLLIFLTLLASVYHAILIAQSLVARPATPA